MYVTIERCIMTGVVWMKLYFGILVFFWESGDCREAFSHPRYPTMWLSTVGSLWLSLFGPQT